jgi:beta-N-acetylhexosaminidase
MPKKNTQPTIYQLVIMLLVVITLCAGVWFYQNNPKQTTSTIKTQLPVGRVFMIGHWANQPVASTTERIQQYQVGGVIIMSTPENPLEITDWVREWQSVSNEPLLIAIDQEGGPVSRLRGPSFTETSQREITSTTSAYLLGKKRGEELQALGITLNFAPVVEGAENPDSFMYDRVFSDKEKIADYAATLSTGLAESGIIAVPKHFPGHADTPADSHNTLPNVPINSAGIAAFTKPFADLIKKNPPRAIMTAHVLYPYVDTLPATLSSFWLKTYLRDTLKFSGVIITDDMSMDAIDTSWSHEEASLLSLKAGADLVLYAAEPERAGAAISRLETALTEGELTETDFYAKIARLKNLTPE